MRISDWSSDVCSSDLWKLRRILDRDGDITIVYEEFLEEGAGRRSLSLTRRSGEKDQPVLAPEQAQILDDARMQSERAERSEEHTSELQSIMRISYAVFCFKKKTITSLKTLLLMHIQ